MTGAHIQPPFCQPSMPRSAANSSAPQREQAKLGMYIVSTHVTSITSTRNNTQHNYACKINATGKKKDDWLCNLQEILGFYNKSL